MERNRPAVPLTGRSQQPLVYQASTPRPSAGDRPDSAMTGQGKLVFQVTAAGGAIPLEGAEITLRQSRGPTDMNGDVLSVLYSGRDGKTESIPLPAPARSYSLEPARDGTPVPYSLYNADVRMEDGYIRIYDVADVEEIVTYLMENGYTPCEIKKNKIGLEEYYIEIMSKGGGKR